MSTGAAAPSFELFKSLFDQGDLHEAERVGERLLIRQSDRSVDILTRIGLLRRRKGLAAPAVEAFLRAKQAAGPARPLPEWFQSELSGAYVELRAWPLALEAAEADLKLKPALGLTAATALVHLGRTATAHSRLRRAVQALAHDPSRAVAVASACGVLLAAERRRHPGRRRGGCCCLAGLGRVRRVARYLGRFARRLGRGREPICAIARHPSGRFCRRTPAPEWHPPPNPWPIRRLRLDIRGRGARRAGQ